MGNLIEQLTRPSVVPFWNLLTFGFLVAAFGMLLGRMLKN